MDFFWLFCAPYLVAFVLLAFMPGWRSLLLFSACALLLCVWVFRDVAKADGPGVFFAAIIAVLLSLGFFAGFLARAIVLLSRSFGCSIPGKAVVTLPLVLIVVPASAIGWTWTQEELRKARMAPPSAACADGVHVAKLGDAMLGVPIAPVITVGTDPTYYFNINQHAREFCDEAASSPPSLERISFDFSNSAVRRAPKDFAFCTEERPFAWWAAACKRDEQLADYPATMTVYVIGGYDAARMHARSAEGSARYRSAMAGLPTRTFAGGAVTEHIGQHHSYFTRSDSDGYIAECYSSKSSSGRDLYCSTGYVLPEGLGLIYDFRASADRFAEQSRRADQLARATFQSLLRP